jgi:hypothetical protein
MINSRPESAAEHQWNKRLEKSKLLYHLHLELMIREKVDEINYYKKKTAIAKQIIKVLRKQSEFKP